MYKTLNIERHLRGDQQDELCVPSLTQDSFVNVIIKIYRIHTKTGNKPQS